MATHRRNAVRMGLAAVSVMVVLAGCGASTSSVTSKAPVETTAAPTTITEAPTTEAPTTEAPTTEAPTTLPDDSTGGGSGSLPSTVKDAFMQGCVKGAGQVTCECVWDKIENELSVEALMEAGSSGSVPSDLQKKIVDATMGCMTSSNS